MDVAPHPLMQTSQTVTTLHSLITLCPFSLLWCPPSVIDTALLLHLVGTGAMSPILTCTCTLACTMPHTHKCSPHIHIHICTPMIMLRLVTFSCLHSHAHWIKCCLSDSHMHLHAWHLCPHPIVFTFACLYQDSQSMMCHLWVNTSDLVLVSDTGSIVTFFLT